MCGIAGMIARTEAAPAPSLTRLGRMIGAIAHRGPDETGVYRDRHAGLAHARLSIIDVTSGQQPLSNEDGTLWVVFNGEIFNYVELREDLIAQGHVFRTRSDTEVIVHAFEAWGEDAFARFNGQFAIALWDSRAHELTLARDRFAERPLFVAETPGVLWFASEVKALFAGAPELTRELDGQGLDETFTFWTSLAPRTVFKGVTELEPGEVRRIGPHGHGRRVVAEVGFPAAGAESFKGSVHEAAEAVRAALSESTRLRITRADVSVGSYLSGGLDSSLVAALGRAHKPGRFQTFSLRFADAEYDEGRFQAEMVRVLEAEHHELVVDAGDIGDVFPDVIRHVERPLLRTAPAPLFMLSRLVRESGTKVVLTGEGADETFAGYDLFREGKVRRFWARSPRSRLRPLLLGRLYPYLARSPVARRDLAREFFGRDLDRAHEPGFAHLPRWRSAAALKRLFSPALRAELAGQDAVATFLAGIPPELRTWSSLAQDQWLEMRTLLSGYLLSAQGDRVAMAHGVEGRLPFLDNGVVALAASLPPAYKLAVLDEKHVLKRAARGLVPESILSRQKQPYRAPDALAFVGPARPDWVDAVLTPGVIASAGVFDPAAVGLLWQKCRGADATTRFSNADNMALVGVLSTQLLHQTLVKSAPAAEAPVRIDTLVDRMREET